MQIDKSLKGSSLTQEYRRVATLMLAQRRGYCCAKCSAKNPPEATGTDSKKWAVVMYPPNDWQLLCLHCYVALGLSILKNKHWAALYHTLRAEHEKQTPDTPQRDQQYRLFADYDE